MPQLDSPCVSAKTLNGQVSLKPYPGPIKQWNSAFKPAGPKPENS